MAVRVKPSSMTDDEYKAFMSERARYWTFVLFKENLIPTWQEDIGDLIEWAYVYCMHNFHGEDVDEVGEERKAHVHLLVACPNSTTRKFVTSIVDRLSAEGKRAFNYPQTVGNVRHMYEYLIHNTEDCRKKHKHAYSPEERIEGNGFDIGLFEQLSAAEKKERIRQLTDDILNIGFYNFADFLDYVAETYDATYYDLALERSSTFERVTRANWQRKVVHDQEENNT